MRLLDLDEIIKMAWKGVTLIKGLDKNSDALATMSKKLKVMCGSGGTVKSGVIEIQGDHIVRVLDYLKKQGVRAKRAGGWNGHLHCRPFDIKISIERPKA